jgi:hypothetical protein
LKKTVLLIMFLTLGMVLLPACSNNNANEISVKANTPFSLPVGKTAVIKGKDFSIKFDSVTADSRCPTGVTCVWAGEAKCNMTVTRNGQKQEVVLTQSGSSAENIQDLLGAYKVNFQLNPYPKAGSQIKPQDYILSMKIY